MKTYLFLITLFISSAVFAQHDVPLTDTELYISQHKADDKYGLPVYTFNTSSEQFDNVKIDLIQSLYYDVKGQFRTHWDGNGGEYSDAPRLLIMTLTKQSADESLSFIVRVVDENEWTVSYEPLTELNILKYTRPHELTTPDYYYNKLANTTKFIPLVFDDETEEHNSRNYSRPATDSSVAIGRLQFARFVELLQKWDQMKTLDNLSLDGFNIDRKLVRKAINDNSFLIKDEIYLEKGQQRTAYYLIENDFIKMTSYIDKRLVDNVLTYREEIGIYQSECVNDMFFSRQSDNLIVIDTVPFHPKNYTWIVWEKFGASGYHADLLYPGFSKLYYHYNLNTWEKLENLFLFKGEFSPRIAEVTDTTAKFLITNNNNEDMPYYFTLKLERRSPSKEELQNLMHKHWRGRFNLKVKNGVLIDIELIE